MPIDALVFEQRKAAINLWWAGATTDDMFVVAVLQDGNAHGG